MIKSILDEYEKQKSSLAQERDQLHNENKAITKTMTDTYIKEANKDVRLIHSNQRRIIEEIRKLKAGTQEFIKQSHNWIELYDGLLVSLKEAGDLANWYEVLEKRAIFIKEKIKSTSAGEEKAEHEPVSEGKKEEG